MMKSLLSKNTKKFVALVAFALISVGAYAQQKTYTDSICAGTQDVVYGITGANATSTYTWTLSDPTAGTIDNSITANDSEIEIDWGTTVGTYTLYAYETTENGCNGDSVQLDVVINPLPTVTMAADSVCEGFSSTLTFEFTGTAPWVVTYSDGTTTFTDTASVTPYSVSLPNYTTSKTIAVTALSDANGCAADPSTLPSGQLIHIFPKPTSGGIYHY